MTTADARSRRKASFGGLIPLVQHLFPARPSLSPMPSAARYKAPPGWTIDSVITPDWENALDQRGLVISPMMT
jgi:hypothetical protein